MLKPCPFCGGEAQLHVENDIFFIAVVVRCKKCGISQPYPKYENDEDAISTWNRRTTQREV